MKLVASISQGLEKEGAKELIELGAKSVQASRRHISFEADMACLYRIHLRARLSFRFLREIVSFPCYGPKDLYEGVQRLIDWENWLQPRQSFRVDVTGFGEGLSHTHFTALKVKNAIIDLQRERWDSRSSIDLNNPDICFHTASITAPKDYIIKPSETLLINSIGTINLLNFSIKKKIDKFILLSSGEIYGNFDRSLKKKI